MIYLDKNATAYNSYFKWKENVVFQNAIAFNPFCQMCIQLHLDDHFGVKKSVLNDLEEFWSEKQCTQPQNLIVK